MDAREEFIAKLYPAARKVAEETGMSWELILAQAAQETGWGQRVLPGTNNIFNIKTSAGWNGESKIRRSMALAAGQDVPGLVSPVAMESRVLREGLHTPAVGELQNQLIQLGYVGTKDAPVPLFI